MPECGCRIWGGRLATITTQRSTASASPLALLAPALPGRSRVLRGGGRGTRDRDSRYPDGW